MLKVGSHEVIQVVQSEYPFHMIVDGASVPEALRRRKGLLFSDGHEFGEPRDGFYLTNPGSESCGMPLKSVRDFYPQLLPAHEAVILRAAHRFNPSTIRAHSTSLVAFLAAETGKPLQQPNYVSPGEPGIEASASSEIYRGGGFGTTEDNKRVERAAVGIVTQRYKGDNWTVKSREHENCGYDLRCTRLAEERHVEVKGTAGSELRFIISENEYRTAQADPAFVLCLVTSALSADPQFHEWRGANLLASFDLQPISYFAKLKPRPPQTPDRVGVGR